jgi:hypothetical protein
MATNWTWLRGVTPALLLWDLLEAPYVFSSAAGAMLLGAITAQLWVLGEIRNSHFREWTWLALGFCLGSWFVLNLNLGAEGELIFWTKLPRTALFMGVGVALCSSLAHLLWIFVKASLARSSWKQRSRRLKLPPLETVERAFRLTSQLSAGLWLIGSILEQILTPPRSELGLFQLSLLTCLGGISLLYLAWSSLTLLDSLDAGLPGVRAAKPVPHIPSSGADPSG